MTSPQPLISRLYRGTVVHKRLAPFVHQFAYKHLSLYLDLDELPALQRRLRLFSHNAWNLFSFRDRDYGPRDGSPLRPWLETHLQAAGMSLDGGAIRLLTSPRVLGYGFNPLSIWFCYHRDGGLRAILYEVANTFGQRHSYLIRVDEQQAAGAPLDHSAHKQFYVSPFMDMAARYDFRLIEPGPRFALSIRQTTAAGLQFVACQRGRQMALSDRALLRIVLTQPWLALKVIGAIHWQALRLWRKGARVRPRPAPPAAAVTAVAWPVPMAAE